MSNHAQVALPDSTAPWYKGRTRSQWNALIAGFIGWALDIFDLLIFNFAIISLMKEFGLTKVETGMIASFTMIASGVGGVIFGIISDRFGRIKALTFTVLLFSIASALCGFSGNLWELLIARCLVGIGIGGEWASGVALISETWPKEHRGKALAIMQSGYSVGGMIATLIAGPVIQAWGWRTLFYIGILPALLVFYLRRHVKESEMWKEEVEKEKASNQKKEIELFTVLKGNLLKFTILGALFCSLVMGATYPYSVWLPTYLASPVSDGGAGLSIAKSSWFVFPYYFGALFGALGFGLLSDKFGRRKTFAAYLVMACIMVFASMQSAKAPFLFVPFVLMAGFFKIGCYAGFGPLLSELFPTKVRSTGEALCYNVARGVGAISITAVGALAGIIGLADAIMVAGSVFLGAAMIIFLFPETAGKDLE